jgi:hypothetical protein
MGIVQYLCGVVSGCLTLAGILEDTSLEGDGGDSIEGKTVKIHEVSLATSAWRLS